MCQTVAMPELRDLEGSAFFANRGVTGLSAQISNFKSKMSDSDVEFFAFCVSRGVTA
jgi:hypothetical protein